MAAFFRGLLLFLFGALVGAGGILFFTPTFNVVVSRNPGSLKPVEFAPAAPPAPTVVKAPLPAPTLPAAGIPVKPVVLEPAKADPAVASAEPALDFKSISEHLILWPTTVTVKSAHTVPVLVDGKKVQDLALEAGTVLQLSKVLADGSLEVRAKGLKFEIKSAQTDFSAELGKRVADLVAKGTKIDPPFMAPPAAEAPSAAVPVSVAPAPAVPAAVDTTPKGPLTLARKVDVLFGVRPEAPVAPVAGTPAVTPPATVVPPPAAEPKPAEKGKDLDRKINQLFK